MRTLAAKSMLLAAGLILSGWSCGASPPADVQSAAKLMREGQEAYRLRGTAAALPMFEEALRIYRRAGDLEGQSDALRARGNCRLREAAYGRALDDFGKSLELSQKLDDSPGIAKALNNLGLTYWHLADYAKARQVLNRGRALAEDLDDPEILASVLNNLGLVHDETGGYAQSLELYQAALTLSRRQGFPKGIADALANLGGRALLLGDHQEAAKLFSESHEISLQAGLKQEAGLALGNRGLALLGLGRPDEALDFLEKGLVSARQLGAGRLEADWSRARAKLLLWTGRYEESLRDLRVVADFYAQAGLQKEEAAAWHEIGGVFLLVGDPAAAEDAFQRSLQSAQNLKWQAGALSARLALGDVDWHRGLPQQALSWYQAACRPLERGLDAPLRAACLMRSALALVRAGRPQEALGRSVEALETARLTEAGSLLAQARAVRGQVEQALGDPSAALPFYRQALQASLDARRPEAAWRIAYFAGTALAELGAGEEAAAAYLQSIDLLESVRRGLERDRFYAGYIDSRYQPYTALVPLLINSGRNAKALMVAERLRNRLQYGAFGLAGDLGDSEASAGAVQDVRLPAQGLEDFQVPPALADSDGFERRLLRIRENLPPDSAVIAFLLTDEKMAVFVLTRKDFHSLLTPVLKDSLTARVSLLRELITQPDHHDFRMPALGLHRLLIAPLKERGWLEGIAHLRIVPHGVLHYLPFSALLGEAPVGTSSGPGPRFLVEDFTISYLNGLQESSPRPRESAEDALLALMPHSARLANAAQEAQRIRQAFRSRIRVVEGREASEPLFKDLAPGYRILHLATHSSFDFSDPLASALLLEKGAGEDGQLTAREIAGLDLAADLVFLSACETGLGAGYNSVVPPGDDFRGLTRAFLDAGSRAVLASLWKVDDFGTASFAGGFYDRRHLDQAEALAEAQREMLKSDRLAHPFFWAPFVLVRR